MPVRPQHERSGRSWTISAYVLTAAPLEPFGDAPGDAPWLESTISAVRDRRWGTTAVATAGPSLEGPGIAAADNVVFNTALLDALRKRAGTEGGRLVIPPSDFSRYIGISTEQSVPLYVLPAREVDVRELDELPPYTIEPDLTEFPLPGLFEMPVPRRFAIHVTDWAALLWANLYGMAAEVVAGPKGRGAWFILRTLFKARSFNPDRIAAAATVMGPGSRVHPSAVVEACLLGPNVRVGPGACVRGSILQEGSTVEALAEVTASIVGRGARVQRQAMVRFSLLWPDAMVGGTVQLAVFGARSRFHGGSYAMDINLDGSNVQVVTGDGKRPAGPALGGCLGHDVTVGSGVWVAPGRAIPNGTVVVRDPAHVLRRIPGDLTPGKTYVVRDGTLKQP